MDMVAIGSRITEERKRLGLSREKFAELIGVTVYYVGQIERGERKMSFDTLINVANCIHMSLDYLVYGKKGTSSGDELQELIERCSPQEKSLTLDVLKAALPHLGNLNR